MNIEPVTIPCRILQRCSTKRGMGILPNDQSGTSGGTRTHTLVKEADFESAASTNSATLALKLVPRVGLEPTTN